MPSTEVKHMSNIEFVTHLMEYSRRGAMSQLFIVDAIDKMSKAVASTPLEELKEAFGEHSIVNAEAWHDTAKEIQERLDARSST